MALLRDRLLSVPDEIDPTHLPPGFFEARDAIRRGIGQAGAAGMTDATVLAVLLSETLPRLVHAYGPSNAAVILSRLANDIGSGLAPNCRQQ